MEKICKKRRYDTREVALVVLKYIRATSKRDKKPVKCYHCIKCSGWHLSSMNSNDYNKMVRYDLNNKKRKREMEADYWTKKLKISD